MKRRGVETVRRICRDIIHSNQPALDLFSSDYISRLFSFPSRPLTSVFFLGNYYKQFRQLMATYRVLSIRHSL